MVTKKFWFNPVFPFDEIEAVHPRNAAPAPQSQGQPQTIFAPAAPPAPAQPAAGRRPAHAVQQPNPTEVNFGRKPH